MFVLSASIALAFAFLVSQPGLYTQVDDVCGGSDFPVVNEVPTHESTATDVQSPGSVAGVSSTALPATPTAGRSSEITSAFSRSAQPTLIARISKAPSSQIDFEPSSEPTSEPPSEPPSEPTSDAPSEAPSYAPSEPTSDAPSEPTSEAPSEAPSYAPSEPVLRIGGALRYNFFYRDFGGGFNENDVTFTIDTWRINATVDWPGNIGLNFEYRFYPSFNTHFIKQGWLEYTHRERHNVQLGVTQVPFGNVQYNSHNWWFQLPYYLGLEDDHDMGLKYTYTSDAFTLAAAWFLMPEAAGPAYGAAAFGIGGSGRYSYDIIPITGTNPWDYVLQPGQTPQSNQERNQFNLQGFYHWTHHSAARSDIGLSLQYHSIYNQVTQTTRWSPALALHLNGDYGRFNVKAQYLYYRYDAIDDAGNPLDAVFMAAYGDPYAVSAEGHILTLGVAYSHDLNWGPVTNIQFYDNFSYMVKSPAGHHPTLQHVIGMLVSAGNVYTYFDVASGMNHPWLTANFGQGLDAGVSDPRINTRFNINIGYYF